MVEKLKQKNYLSTKEMIDYFCQGIARKYPNKKDVEDYFVANFLQNKNGYIKNFSEDYYKAWKTRVQSITYNLTNEISPFADRFEELFVWNDNHPVLLKEYLGRRVSIETMVVLDELVGYIKDWDNSDIIWKDHKKLIEKYKKFLTIDTKKCKNGSNEGDSMKHYVYGNGESRKGFAVSSYYGVSWGCNAIYRDHEVDNLVAVDYGIQGEIVESGYAKRHQCYFSDWNLLPTTSEMLLEEMVKDWKPDQIHYYGKDVGQMVVNGSGREKDKVKNELGLHVIYPNDEDLIMPITELRLGWNNSSTSCLSRCGMY